MVQRNDRDLSEKMLFDQRFSVGFWSATLGSVSLGVGLGVQMEAQPGIKSAAVRSIAMIRPFMSYLFIISIFCLYKYFIRELVLVNKGAPSEFFHG